ncbi:MAG: glycosyltransferase family 39 protein [Pseudorhodoplanes sp.]
MCLADRLLSGLLDPKRRDGVVLALLAAYAVVWTLYFVLERSSQDVHYDMAEVVAWSRDLSLGGSKHPALSAWIAALWFKYFPLRDWAYYLLAMVSAAVTLWVDWLIIGRWLDGSKRVAGFALLTLLHFFNFFAFKFNANTVLLPVWALTTLFFIRSYENRKPSYAALAGLCAAGAMMGKYWSVFMLIGLAVAALAGGRRREYFRSPAPWITAAAGLAALAPHLYWLWTHDFVSVRYAAEAHAADSIDDVVSTWAFYSLGVLASVVIPMLLVRAFARVSAREMIRSLWPQTPERRLAAIVFWIPLLLPLAAAFAMESDLRPIWILAGMSLLPVVLLSSPRIAVSVPAAGAITLLALAFPLVSLVVSPMAAAANYAAGISNHGADYRLLAGRVQKIWNEGSDRRIAFVGGRDKLAEGAAFYLKGRPRVVPIASLSDDTERDALRRRGFVFICSANQETCLDSLNGLTAWLPFDTVREITVRPRFLGRPGPEHRYVIAIARPEPRTRKHGGAGV